MISISQLVGGTCKIPVKYRNSLLILDKNILKSGRKSFAAFNTNMSFQENKDRYLKMSLQEKRKLYKCKKPETLENISTWQKFYETEKDDLPLLTEKAIYTPNEDMNNKVSLFFGDITSLEIDAIVNAANNQLLRGGGVCGAIHNAAGKDLEKECKTLQGCPTGEAKLTGGYLLPSKYVIMTVGPVGEKASQLKSCYVKSLNLLLANDLRSVAFPCISTGIYGYPQDKAAEVAISTVQDFLQKNSNKVDRVIFCLFTEEDKTIYKKLMQKYFPV